MVSLARSDARQSIGPKSLFRDRVLSLCRGPTSQLKQGSYSILSLRWRGVLTSVAQLQLHIATTPKRIQFKLSFSQVPGHQEVATP